MQLNVDNIEIPSVPKIEEKPTIPISQILSDSNTTIENILNYPTILDEINSKNEELLKYFQKDKIKILIDFIIKEQEEDNFEKGHKFPFLCCEIFKSGKDELLNKFFVNENNKENENFELLDYLLSFLQNKNESKKKLNNILCGYFSSVIESLLNYNPNSFLEYIYLKRKDVLNIMAHCYDDSIMDLLSQLLFIENFYKNNDKNKLSETNKNEFNKIRYDILIDIFKNIKIDMDNEELNSIYCFITKFFSNSNIDQLKEAFKKVIINRFAMKNLIYNTIYNSDLINYLDNDLLKIENKRKNFIIIIDIIIFLLKTIKYLSLEIPSCSSSNDKKSNIKHTKISQEIFNILERLIKVNFIKRNSKDSKILSSFDEYSFIPLGEYKIKIIELISSLIPYFSNISKYFDEIIIKTNFFKTAFEYLFEYECNNLYQEQFLNLFKVLLIHSPEHDMLINHLIKDIKLFEIIKEHIIDSENSKFKFNNEISTPISRGYKAFLINLSYKLNIAMGGEPIGQNLNGSFEFRHYKSANEEYKFSFNFGNDININVNNNEKVDNLNNKIIELLYNECMEKYATEDWNIFYKNNILDLIKQYANKEWPIKKEGNICDFLFEEKKEDNSNHDNKKLIENEINSEENNLNNKINEEENTPKNEENQKTE